MWFKKKTKKKKKHNHSEWAKIKGRQICHCNECGRTVVVGKKTPNKAFGKPAILRSK